MEENKIQTKRYISLDVIKILSAFMVVFYHFRYFDLGHFENGNYILSVPQFLLCFCSASIPMFFMVNGALMLNKKRTTKEIYAKAGKLALISLVWNSLVGFYTWFFHALIVLYLIYPFLIKIFTAKRRLWLYILMGSVFVFPFLYNFVIVLFELFAPSFSINIFGYTLSLQTLPLRTGVFRLYSILYFMLGGVIMNKSIKPIISVISIIAGQTITVFDVIITSNYTHEVADAVNRCFPSIGGLLLAFGIFGLLRNLDRIKFPKFAKITASLGGGGVLVIYLLHVRIRSILTATILPFKPYPIMLMLAVDILVCAFCFLVNYILQKIPIIKELVHL